MHPVERFFGEAKMYLQKAMTTVKAFMKRPTDEKPVDYPRTINDP